MSKKSAFSFFEVMLIILIIGLIFVFCIPVLIDSSSKKIQNARFYESYRALSETAKKLQQEIPSGRFDELRSSETQKNVCDRFRENFSVTGNNVPDTILQWCPDDETKHHVGLGAGLNANGLCPTTCVPTPCNTPCAGNQPATQIDCSTALIGNCNENTNPKYCKLPPNRAELFDTCDDLSTNKIAGPQLEENTSNYACATPKIDWVTGNLDATSCPNSGNRVTPASNYTDNTKFDAQNIVGNFTTANGLTFYGLEKYPAECICNSGQLHDSDLINAGKLGITTLKSEGDTCNFYRNIYIDTNGKNPDKQDVTCGTCTTNPNDPHTEAQNCENVLACLRSKGIYKFRLYNDGHVEPMTNRINNTSKMRYKLYFEKDGKIMEVERQFESYDEARNCDITDAQNSYRYFDKTTSNYVSQNTSITTFWDTYLCPCLDGTGNHCSCTQPVNDNKREDNTPKVVTGQNITQPCQGLHYFRLFQCEIVPVIPGLKTTFKH